MKTGTLGLYGKRSDTERDHKNQDRYWFWTSVDISQNSFQAGKQFLVVSTADENFASNSPDNHRASNRMTYNVIIKSTSYGVKQQIESITKIHSIWP